LGADAGEPYISPRKGAVSVSRRGGQIGMELENVAPAATAAFPDCAVPLGWLYSL